MVRLVSSISIGMVIVWVAAICGWVMNLIAVIQAATADAPLTAMFIVRLVGVPVAIIGAILGWF